MTSTIDAAGVKLHTAGVMAKAGSGKTVFECSSCGRTTPKWVGKCSQCGEWNTVEEHVDGVAASGNKGLLDGLMGKSRHAPGGPSSLGDASQSPRLTPPVRGRSGRRFLQQGLDGSGENADGFGTSARSAPDYTSVDAPDGLSSLGAASQSLTPNLPQSGGGSILELSQMQTGGTTYLPTGIEEFDRVLGGGFVPGSAVLVAGDPGIGKSTLLLQASDAVARSGRKVLYASGEESLEQIKLRAARLGISGDGVYMLESGDVAEIVPQVVAVEPAVIVVDSIQTATHPEVDSHAGTVSQIRESAALMAEVAKRTGAALILSGHVTKDGSIAGPRVLEHQVDAVLQMGGDSGAALRLLHGVKNRFGATDEVGVFEMYGEGLRGVADPSNLFVEQRAKSVPGSVIAMVVEGTRSLAVEIQALATPSTLASPRRVANGVDVSRLHMITAVIAKHLRLPVTNHDLVISVTGGLDVKEPAADIAIALAIVSSLLDRPVNDGVAVAGEIGLAGELRSVSRSDRRVAEASRLGFEKCLLPDSTRDKIKPSAIDVVQPSNIAEAVRFGLQSEQQARIAQESHKVSETT
ncbi:MAG: DNA repair protein RadA [Dehalococcoidia bacterium]